MPIRKWVREVRVTLVATDSSQRPLGLSPADIMVLEDGRPVPHFELRSADDRPLRVAIGTGREQARAARVRELLANRAAAAGAS